MVAEEPLKDKAGIEKHFLFNFLKRDQKSLEDGEEDNLWKSRFQMTLIGECFVSTNVILRHQR